MSDFRFFSTHRSWEDWFGMLLGVLIVVSPWFPMQPAHEVMTTERSTVVLNTFVIGMLVFGLAQLEYVALQRWEEVGEIILGLWLISSPLVFGYTGEGFLPIWMSVGRVIHCHNSWHLGVAQVAELDCARALDVFARHVWGITPDLVVEQADAIALLWRIEMAGERVDQHWAELADRAETHIEERYMPFLDAHFAFALYHYHQRDYESALGEAMEIHAPAFFWTSIMRAMILGQLDRRDDAAA